MTGLRPTVVGLIASTVISLGYGVFFPNGFSEFVFDFTFVYSLVIFLVVCFFAFKKTNPIYLIMGSAAMGIAMGYAEKIFSAS